MVKKKSSDKKFEVGIALGMGVLVFSTCVLNFILDQNLGVSVLIGSILAIALGLVFIKEL